MRNVVVVLLLLCLAVQAETAESVARLRADAEQGDVDAAYQLALAYRDGKDAPKDYVEAYAWFDVAAAVLDDEHGVERDELAKNMTPEQLAQARQRSRDYFRKYLGPLLQDAE
jgi:TPR repeat protein